MCRRIMIIRLIYLEILRPMSYKHGYGFSLEIPLFVPLLSESIRPDGEIYGDRRTRRRRAR